MRPKLRRFYDVIATSLCRLGVSDLKILDYDDCDPLAENIEEPILKPIVKYRNHGSTLTKKNPEFSFRCLDASKPCQDSDTNQKL